MNMCCKYSKQLTMMPHNLFNYFKYNDTVNDNNIVTFINVVAEDVTIVVVVVGFISLMLA